MKGIKIGFWLFVVASVILLTYFMGIELKKQPNHSENIVQKKVKKDIESDKKEDDLQMANRKTIYLAGGCFWGLEAYFQKIDGVISTEVGYANGKTKETTYEKVSQTDHAETVKVDYDMSKVSLEEVLLHYFRIIDPTSVNRQGNDVGRQYRTGIYYTGENDRHIIDKVMDYETKKHGKLVVESEALTEFIKAEDYHQDYLKNNSGGYCHIDLNLAEEPLLEEDYVLPTKEEMKKRLDQLSYDVIVNSATERPFSSELNDEYKKGIYVDKVTKEPLFASKDKFDSGCGWPSFSKPILTGRVKEFEDNSLGMRRMEVRAEKSKGHLGHVFEDGPKEMGGLRYCINGASLEFVPYEDMDEMGYSEYKIFCE